MSPNIISWRTSADDYTNILSASPISSRSATPSVVSIDSMVPGREAMAWPDAREAQPASESQVKSPPSAVVLSEPKAPISLRPVQDSDSQPFVRHDTYYFEDGNITFLVDGVLYCVHRYFFARDSIYFSTRFAQLNIREHEALPTLISLGDIKRGDFEAFLNILYPPEFDGRDLSYEQWKAVLHLSTLWGFPSVRGLALASLKPPTPFDQLLLGRAYAVEHYIVPALSSLCERPEPLTLGEVRQMRSEDVVLVASVRESIRGAVLEIDPSDIPASVRVALSHLSVPHSDSGALLRTLRTARMGAEAAEREESERATNKVRAKVQAAARRRVDAELMALGEYEEAMARVEAEAKAKADAEAKAAAEEKAKAEAEAMAKAKAEEAKRAAEQAAYERARAIAKAKAFEEARAKAGAERAEAEGKMKAKAEAEAMAKVDSVAAKAKAETEATGAAASNAPPARSAPMNPATNRGSGGGGWFNKLSAASSTVSTIISDDSQPTDDRGPMSSRSNGNPLWGPDPWAKRQQTAPPLTPADAPVTNIARGAGSPAPGQRTLAPNRLASRAPRPTAPTPSPAPTQPSISFASSATLVQRESESGEAAEPGAPAL